MKVIITGATGMVGEGVLFECLENPNVSKVLIVNRRHYELSHPKLKELLVPDFTKLESYTTALTGYDACFYCAGISSIGMDEATYTYITFDTTMSFAKTLVALNPDMVFNYVSGGHTDSSESGKMMWARVKGRTENALVKLPFKGVYNFRPGFMKAFPEQRNVKFIFKLFSLLFPVLFPSKSLTLKEVGQAMVNSVLKGYQKQVLEIEDIKILASKQ